MVPIWLPAGRHPTGADLFPDRSTAIARFGTARFAFHAASAEHGGPWAAPARRRILVVEDEYYVALEVEGWLTEANYEVVGVVSTADEAVAAADQCRPDLIFMDIRLAGSRDGIEAATEIVSRTGIRCLFASAYGDEQTRKRAEPARPLGWLSKPYRKQELLRAVSAALRQSGD